MDMKKLVDLMSAQLASERSKTQMTLGEFIGILEGADKNIEVRTDDGFGLGDTMSYRGHYSDLCFEKTSDITLAGDVLKRSKEALGDTFEGYKGGDFTMTKVTPLWSACYGGCGRKLLSASIVNGALVIVTGEDE